MSQPKTRSLKHISIPEIYAKYPTIIEQSAFFFDLKWPDGFTCPYCGGKNCYFYPENDLCICKDCARKTSIKAGTIMQDSKLSFMVWILMVYLIADNMNGISALELSRKIGIGYTSARLNSRKIKYAMMKRNDQFLITEQVVEHDEVLIGAPSRNGKRGLGTDQLPVNMNVGLTNGNNPSHIRFDIAENLKCETGLQSLLACVEKGATLKIDGKRGAENLWKSMYKIDSKIQKDDHEHLHWLNTIVSNLKSFIQGTYHGISKKYMIFNLAEFEWRFNRRYYGKRILESGVRLLLHTSVMTDKNLVSFFQS